MRALIADDDRGTALALSRALARWGLQVLTAHSGAEAWELLRAEDTPALAILDWIMPPLDGPDVCRLLRRERPLVPTYVILLTSRDSRADLTEGLDAGADDYLVKPFDPEELRARVHVGIRILTLQERLAARVEELQAALSRVKQLRGLLPICSYCKRIRTDENYWQGVETYVAEHSEAEFSHGICPPCFEAAMVAVSSERGQ